MSPALPGHWTKWFSRRRPRGKSPARPRSASRPAFEHLEDRIVPATRVWSGASLGSASWSDNNNWVGAVAPKPNDDLLFPGGALQTATTNDDFTGANNVFNSITVDGAGYTFSGASVTIGAGGLTVNSAAGSGTVTFGIPITLSAALKITNTFDSATLSLAAINNGGFALTFDGSGLTQATGVISSAGPLVKNGPGTVVLSAANTYGGVTTVNAGILGLSGFGTPGSAATGTVVNAGAQLALYGTTNPTSEALTLNGNGLGVVGPAAKGATQLGGALEIAPGSSPVTGTITLGSDATIGVDPGATLADNAAGGVVLAGHTLTVNVGAAGTATFTAPLNPVAGAGGLTVNSALTTGTVNLRLGNGYTGATTVAGGTLNVGGAGGSLASTSLVIGRGGTLVVDNSTAVLASRIPDAAAVTLNGGTLRLVGGASAVTESVGTVTLNTGHSVVQVNPGAGATVLSAAGLVRKPGATVNFSSTGVLGSATAQAKFGVSVPGTSTTSTNAVLMPYATVSDTDFAKYTATGVAAFAAADYKTFATAGPTDVVKLNGTTSTLNTNLTLAGLLITNNGKVTFGLGGLTLTLASGGLLLNGATISPLANNTDTLKFGSEGFVFTNASTAASTITTQVTGTAGVDFSGPASALGLTLDAGVFGNGWTGGTFLNSTNLSVRDFNPLGGAANPLNLVGGTLGSPDANYNQLNNVINLSGANASLSFKNGSLSGQVTLTGTNVLTVLTPSGSTTPGLTTLTGKITGTGSLNVLGDTAATSLVLAPAVRSDYSGGTVVAGGTLVLQSATGPLGSGPVTLTGSSAFPATLQNMAGAAVSLANALSLNNASLSGAQQAVISGTSSVTFLGPVTLTGLTSLQISTPTSFAGVMSGSGGLIQGGTGTLSLSGTNTDTGALMITGGGALAVNGNQASSPIGVITGTLSGAGQVGPITVGPLGTDEPGTPGVANGIQAAPVANFSEGGNLTIQISDYTAAGTDYSRLDLGSSFALLGGSATAPAAITLDLNGLTNVGQANGVLAYGSPLGSPPVFSNLRVVNNPNDFAAFLDYAPNGVNVVITAGTITPPALPTTDVWTGLGSNGNWSNANNWLGGQAPTAGDDLVFPAGAATLITINDMKGIGGGLIRFSTITVEAGGYSFSGNDVFLTSGLTTTEPADGTNPTVTVNLNIQFTGITAKLLDTYAGTSLVVNGTLKLIGGTLTVDGSGTTTLTGQITGTGGLTMAGSGTLNVLPGNGLPSDYTGQTTLQSGLTVVSNSNSLGANANTVVVVNGTLETITPITLRQTYLLNGWGIVGPNGTRMGALYAATTLTMTGTVRVQGFGFAEITNVGPLALQGPVQVFGQTIIFNNNSSINFAAPIIDGPGASPGGGVVFEGAVGSTVSITANCTFTGATVIEGGTVTLSGAGALSASPNIILGLNAETGSTSGYLPTTIGTLVVNDSAPNNARFLNTTTLTLRGGAFTYIGAANASSLETIGSLFVSQGQSFVRMASGIGKNASLILRTGSITRSPGAAVDFSWSGYNFGNHDVTNNNEIVVTGGAPSGIDAAGILPYATVSKVPAAGDEPLADFVTTTLDSANHPVLTTFGGYTQLSTAGAGSVVLIDVSTGGSQTVGAGASQTVDAVLIRTGFTLTIGAGAVLTINSALLTTPNPLPGVVSPAPAVFGPGTLSLGPSETVVMSYSPAGQPTALDATIAGPGILTLAGSSVIDLAPPAGNTYTGITFLDSGMVIVDTPTSPFGTQQLTLFGGTLAVNTANPAIGNALTIDNPLKMAHGSTQLVGLPLTAGASAPLALTFDGDVFLSDLGLGTGQSAFEMDNTLNIPQNVTVTLTGVLDDGGSTPAGGLVMVGGGAANGTGTLVLTNAGNDYAGGTFLGNPFQAFLGITGSTLPTLILGDVGVLGAGTLFIDAGTVEAIDSVPLDVPNLLDVEGATATLGGVSPNDGPLNFTGGMQLSGNSTLVAVVPVLFAGGPIVDTPVPLGFTNQQSRGALNVVGSVTLSGPNNTYSGATSNSPGPIEIDDTQTASPVNVTQTTLQGSGSVGFISAGPSGLVTPGTPAQKGILTSSAAGGGANFSNNGTLVLRVSGSTTPGVDFDQLNLGTNPLVVGGTSRLVLDLSGLSGLSTAITVPDVIIFGTLLGNVQAFNEVDIINNPNNYAVEVDYTDDPALPTDPGVINLVVALGSVDTPTITLPTGAQSTPEDIPLPFTPGGGNALSISDPVALYGLKMSLAVTHGTLTLTNPAGLTFVNGTSNGQATITFTGTLAAINTAFQAGLTYQPTFSFFGPDILTVSATNPGGPALLGSSRTGTSAISINVIQTPAAPTFTIGPNKSVNDNSGAQTFTNWATNIQARPPHQTDPVEINKLIFTTTNDNPGLFAVQPAVARTGTTGTLTFTPQLNNGGIAHVTVTIINAPGMPDFAGDIKSSSQTFTISVTNTNGPSITNVILHWGSQSQSLAAVVANGHLDVPFQGVNAIDLVFNQKITVDPGGLTISGLSGNYALSGPFTAGVNTLQWRLSTPLAAAAGYDNVNILLNGSKAHTQTGQLFGANASRSFKVLIGDVDGNGTVDLNDQLAITRGLTTKYSGLGFYLDLDGDGSITMQDYYIARGRNGNKLH
jgi:autotransporter-associated beta strand protein